MSRAISTLLTFFLLLSVGYSQSFKGLLFSETTYNFGTVPVWDNPPAVFSFENTTFDPMYILTPKTGRRVYVEYPKNRIESGEKGEIKIYFYTDKTGPFSEEIQIYSSTSPAPITLHVKGSIKTLAENALTQCPDFSSPGTRPVNSDYVVEGIVIDKITRQPIPKSVVHFVGIDAIYTDNRGEFKEKIQTGIYVSLAQAEGYRDLNLMVGVKRDMGKVVYELIPLTEQPVERDTTPEKIDTVPVVIQPEVDTIPSVPVETPEFSYREYKANNVVFLVDVSGSMKQGGRMDSLKSAMNQLAGILRSVDNITLITFATTTNVVITDVPGDKKEQILPIIESLIAKGTTNGVLGIEKAFATALEDYIADGNNQVIVATDGAFNSPNYSETELMQMITAYRNKGIKLSVIGFSKESKAVAHMKKMSNTGGGNYIQFGDGGNVQKMLVEEIKNNSRR